MNVTIHSSSVGDPGSSSLSMRGGFERGFVIAVLAICLCKLVVYLLIVPRY